MDQNDKKVLELATAIITGEQKGLITVVGVPSDGPEIYFITSKLLPHEVIGFLELVKAARLLEIQRMTTDLTDGE